MYLSYRDERVKAVHLVPSVRQVTAVLTHSRLYLFIHFLCWYFDFRLHINANSDHVVSVTGWCEYCWHVVIKWASPCLFRSVTSGLRNTLWRIVLDLYQMNPNAFVLYDNVVSPDTYFSPLPTAIQIRSFSGSAAAGQQLAQCTSFVLRVWRELECLLGRCQLTRLLGVCFSQCLVSSTVGE